MVGDDVLSKNSFENFAGLAARNIAIRIAATPSTKPAGNCRINFAWPALMPFSNFLCGDACSIDFHGSRYVMDKSTAKPNFPGAFL